MVFLFPTLQYYQYHTHVAGSFITKDSLLVIRQRFDKRWTADSLEEGFWRAIYHLSADVMSTLCWLCVSVYGGGVGYMCVYSPLRRDRQCVTEEQTDRPRIPFGSSGKKNSSRQASDDAALYSVQWQHNLHLWKDTSMHNSVFDIFI